MLPWILQDHLKRTWTLQGLHKTMHKLLKLTNVPFMLFNEWNKLLFRDDICS